ncbi:MAG: hypothetical protein D6743_07355 [Calditrichaeota bacterium]|nr:MAG: hypothetical protein D6743_07355 [Calditrichota bacterium]
MLNENGGLVKFILSVLLFPTFFQEAFLRFAWGAGDATWLMFGKRLFLLLPVAAIILGCWLTVACLLTVLIRPNRTDFVTNLLITWWDLGKSIAAFWGGVFKFAFHLFVSFLAFLRIAVLSLWSLIHEFVLMPFRLMGRAGRSLVASRIPWIAVSLTLFWCFIEATIFTYVTTPLVVDTFSNITGDSLTEGFVRVPLFVFLLFVVLGSYAVLSTFVDALRQKKISAIVGIGVIEVVVLFVEVVFLYREFVDSLVPWFAQYSENFELGMFWTLAISTFAWFGIRSLSWFLFAAHGTPTILAVIQGKGLQFEERAAQPALPRQASPSGFIHSLQNNADWVQKEGEALLASFVLPPLQVVAAAINFCTLLLSGTHLFDLPVTQLDAVKFRGAGMPPAEVVQQNSSVEVHTVPREKVGELQHV